MSDGRILVVKPGQSPAEAEAEQQVKAHRAQIEMARKVKSTSISMVVRSLFVGFADDHQMAIDVCLEHAAQLALAGGIERKQVVAWFFERCTEEEKNQAKQREMQETALVNGLQQMRAQGLKVPPNVMGQLNLLQVELEPELKKWVEENQAPQNQLATTENLHGLPPGAIQ